MNDRQFDGTLKAVQDTWASFQADRKIEERRYAWEAEHGRPALVAVVHPDQEEPIRNALNAAKLSHKLSLRTDVTVTTPGTIYVMDQSAIHG